MGQMSKKLALAALSVFFTAGAHAALDLKGEGEYGTAGCGLGSMVFGNQKGMVQVLAATTNGTSGTQTFGITSGTSNCEQTTVRGKKTSAVKFIEANKVALSNDVARGEGETLAQLSSLYGCGHSQDAASIWQANYNQIFPTSQVSAVNVEKEMKTLLQEKGLCQG